MGVVLWLGRELLRRHLLGGSIAAIDDIFVCEHLVQGQSPSGRVLGAPGRARIATITGIIANNGVADVYNAVA